MYISRYLLLLFTNLLEGDGLDEAEGGGGLALTGG